jgi:hypothetical protein
MSSWGGVRRREGGEGRDGDKAAVSAHVAAQNRKTTLSQPGCKGGGHVLPHLVDCLEVSGCHQGSHVELCLGGHGGGGLGGPVIGGGRNRPGLVLKYV